MIVLALDTALGACSAAVTLGECVLASFSEPMARGHQERLAPMIREVMEASGLAFVALDRIAVTLGPGSFTGLRVGLSFAKGLALALGIPCVGVGTLEALAASAPLAGARAAGPSVAVIDAGRGAVYLQIFEDGSPLSAPDRLPLEIAAARVIELQSGAPLLVGPGAALLAAVAPGARIDLAATPDITAVARLAAAAAPTPPRPLYLRPPDALPKPPRPPAP
jgi:tRNA threonylcarbamoyladenosine biosynthesis protein TsaB